MFSIFESLHSYVTTDLSVQQEPCYFETSTQTIFYVVAQSKLFRQIIAFTLYDFVIFQHASEDLSFQ